MAICDICHELMPGTNASQQWAAVDGLRAGWVVATFAQVSECFPLVEHALRLKTVMDPRATITTFMAQLWIDQMRRSFGESDWLLCPKCAGFLHTRAAAKPLPSKEPAGPPSSDLAKSIPVRCRCGKRWEVDASLAGKRILCSACQERVSVPDR